MSHQLDRCYIGCATSQTIGMDGLLYIPTLRVDHQKHISRSQLAQLVKAEAPYSKGRGLNPGPGSREVVRLLLRCRAVNMRGSRGRTATTRRLALDLRRL
eukprot:scaffold2959_cov35-Prasinocladus_malaysianus.AAC.1